MTDYYEILGVETTASFDEIKKRYRELSLIFHPDKIKTSLSEEMMKKINEAYSVLSDPKQRQQYDANSDNFQEKNTQNQENQAQKSAKDVWKDQLKEMGKGLSKLWNQYLEYQRKNQAKTDSSFENQNTRHTCEGYHCNSCCHHNDYHSHCDCEKQEKKPEKNNSGFSWENPFKEDQEFLDNMFGFGNSTKEKKNE